MGPNALQTDTIEGRPKARWMVEGIIQRVLYEWPDKEDALQWTPDKTLFHVQWKPDKTFEAAMLSAIFKDHLVLDPATIKYECVFYDLPKPSTYIQPSSDVDILYN